MISLQFHLLNLITFLICFVEYFNDICKEIHEDEHVADTEMNLSEQLKSVTYGNPDTINIAEMDYSPARRKSPIHN